MELVFLSAKNPTRFVGTLETSGVVAVHNIALRLDVKSEPPAPLLLSVHLLITHTVTLQLHPPLVDFVSRVANVLRLEELLAALFVANHLTHAPIINVQPHLPAAQPLLVLEPQCALRDIVCLIALLDTPNVVHQAIKFVVDFLPSVIVPTNAKNAKLVILVMVFLEEIAHQHNLAPFVDSLDFAWIPSLPLLLLTLNI